MWVAGKKTFIHLTVLLYVIAALHIAALYFFWYWSFWWYDILMHVLGGVWIGGMALFFASRLGRDVTASFLTHFAVPLCAVLVFGLLWEAFEWNIDRIVLFRFDNDIIDTLSDMGAGITGGLVASVAWGMKPRTSKDETPYAKHD